MVVIFFQNITNGLKYIKTYEFINFSIILYQNVYFICNGRHVIIMAEQISTEICFIQSYSFPQVSQMAYVRHGFTERQLVTRGRMGEAGGRVRVARGARAQDNLNLEGVAHQLNKKCITHKKFPMKIYKRLVQFITNNNINQRFFLSFIQLILYTISYRSEARENIKYIGISCLLMGKYDSVYKKLLV